MKKPNVKFAIAVVPALVSTEIVLTLAKLDFSLFRDPFSVTRFVVKLAVLLGFTWLYGAIVQHYWKGSRDS